MSKQVDLACTVCTEEFVVPIGVYKAHSSVVMCPCCGSTDLVLLGETWSGDKRAWPGDQRAPATAA